jgi:hypothetical protein
MILDIELGEKAEIESPKRVVRADIAIAGNRDYSICTITGFPVLRADRIPAEQKARGACALVAVKDGGDQAVERRHQEKVTRSFACR